jgi:hypothetical protein
MPQMDVLLLVRLNMNSGMHALSLSLWLDRGDNKS